MDMYHSVPNPINYKLKSISQGSEENSADFQHWLEEGVHKFKPRIKERPNYLGKMFYQLISFRYKEKALEIPLGSHKLV